MRIFNIFRNLWKLCVYDIDEIISNDLDIIIENSVNDKYNDLIRNLNNILDRNSEIYKKLERDTYKKRIRPDVTLRNINQAKSPETRQKMRDAWAKRKQKLKEWEDALNPERLTE